MLRRRKKEGVTCGEKEKKEDSAWTRVGGEKENLLMQGYTSPYLKEEKGGNAALI